MFKTAILKIDEVEPIQKGGDQPLLIGDVVQKLNPEKGKDRYVGPPMRVMQIAGAHILTNYSE